jgi:hypothetical protein
MSYDLYLFQPEPGVDPKVTAEKLMLEEDEAAAGEDGELDLIKGLNPGEPNPEYEQRKRKIAELLTASDVDLEVFRFDFDELAKAHNISKEEARKRFRHIELNGPEDVGAQIELEDTTGAISLPYWHSGAAAVSAFKKIWSYLEILEREGGYRVYDPQLDKVLDLEHDFAKVVGMYEAGVQFTGQAVGQFIEQLAQEDDDDS